MTSSNTNQLISAYHTTTAGLGNTASSDATTSISTTNSNPILSFKTASAENTDTYTKAAQQTVATDNDDEEDIIGVERPGYVRDVGVASATNPEGPYKLKTDADTTRDVSITQTGEENVQPPAVQSMKINGIKVENGTIKITGESTNSDGSTSTINSEFPQPEGVKQEFYRLVTLPKEQTQQN